MEKGYFSGTLRIRRATTAGKDKWTTLDRVLAQVQQEALQPAAPAAAAPAPALRATAPAAAAPAPQFAAGGGGGRRGGRGPRAAESQGPAPQRGYSQEVYSPRGGGHDRAGYDRGGFEPGPRGGGGRRNPRDDFMDRGGYDRGSYDRGGFGGDEYGGGRGRGRGRDRGGRGGRGEGRGGRGGGRGGRGGSRPSGPDPAVREAVQRLFAGEVGLQFGSYSSRNGSRKAMEWRWRRHAGCKAATAGAAAAAHTLPQQPVSAWRTQPSASCFPAPTNTHYRNMFHPPLPTRSHPLCRPNRARSSLCGAT